MLAQIDKKGIILESQHKDYLKRNEMFYNERIFNDNNVYFIKSSKFWKEFKLQQLNISWVNFKRISNKICNIEKIYRKNVYYLIFR